MCKNCLLLLTSAVVVIALGILLCWLRVSQIPPATRVTLRYISGTNSLSGQVEPTFWATNHSGKSLSLQLRAVEIQTNGAWVTCSQIPLSGQLFFPVNQGNPGPRGDSLAPHAAGFGSLLYQHLILPTNAVWRVSGTVVETMEGGDAIIWTVSHARLLWQLRRAGNTSIPLNPFAANYTRVGRPSVVVSEAVSR